MSEDTPIYNLPAVRREMATTILAGLISSGRANVDSKGFVETYPRKAIQLTDRLLEELGNQSVDNNIY